MKKIGIKGKALLVVLLLISLNSRLVAQSSDSTLSQLERKWSNAATYALKVAALMPEAYFEFKPVPEEMSFREQLLHMAKNIHWLSTAFLLSDPKVQDSDSSFRDKASVLRHLKETYERALSVHQKFNPQQLDETVPFFAGPMSRRRVFFLMHDHQSHHIGQLIVYLRLMGIQPPPYVGW